VDRTSRTVIASLLISALLAVSPAALAASPAAAEPAAQTAPAKGGAELVAPKLTRDQAIAIAKKSFPIPASLGEPNVSIQQSREGVVWSLGWQSPSKQAEQTNISVSVDGLTGTVVSYSKWSSTQEQALQLSLTRDEAKKMAEEWLAKLVPAEYRGSLRFIASPLNAGYWGGTGYGFTWVRDVEGHPLSGDGVRISVDARTGEVSSYSLSWRPQVNLTLPEKRLSQAEAEAAYRKQVPLVLQYMRFTRPGTDDAEWRLVYRPLSDSFPLMNQDGVALSYNGEPVDLAALTKTRAVPAADKPYVKPAKPLEQSEALAVAQAVTGRAGAPNSANYSEYGDEVKRAAWDFSWVSEPAAGEKAPRAEQRVRIDAETGLVTEFNNWAEIKPFEKDEQVPVSLEQAQEKAIAFIRAHRPDLAGNIQLVAEDRGPSIKENPDFKPTEYGIRFQLLKNGIPVLGRDIQVSIDARTGEVRNFWSAWYDEKPGESFPTPEPKVTAEQAMTAFFEQQGIEAAWVAFWSPERHEQTAPVFVWQPTGKLPISAIDAQTGAPLDWSGRNLIEAQRYPSDIKGHYAEREIELLWARGVFDLQDGKFHPNDPVTVDDLARWIVLAGGMRPYVAYDFAKVELAAPRAAALASQSANAAYYGAAFQSGIILPEELEGIGNLYGSVSRELFALWATRAMGYGRIAKMGAQIELPFADKDQIGAKYRNAVAILAGLGIVSGDANYNFHPQQALTRADAAKILFAVSSR
jgi:hypothetical protein